MIIDVSGDQLLMFHVSLSLARRQESEEVRVVGGSEKFFGVTVQTRSSCEDVVEEIEPLEDE